MRRPNQSMRALVMGEEPEERTGYAVLIDTESGEAPLNVYYWDSGQITEINLDYEVLETLAYYFTERKRGIDNGKEERFYN